MLLRSMSDWLSIESSIQLQLKHSFVTGQVTADGCALATPGVQLLYSNPGNLLFDTPVPPSLTGSGMVSTKVPALTLLPLSLVLPPSWSSSISSRAALLTGRARGLVGGVGSEAGGWWGSGMLLCRAMSKQGARKGWTLRPMPHTHDGLNVLQPAHSLLDDTSIALQNRALVQRWVENSTRHHRLPAAHLA
jgi:hypothetical protein